MTSLGTITKFASQPPKSLAEFTGTAGKTAASFRLQSIARELTPNERVRICWRHRLPDTPHLTLVHIPAQTPAGKPRGHVRGLMHCCSVWVCPVCSGRISTQRREELLTAVNDNRERYQAVHVTYTARHTKRDRLSDQLTAMQDAYRKLRSGRWWQAFKQRHNIVASVRATEITHGANGWHPHYHELMFVEIPHDGENPIGWPNHDTMQLAVDGLHVGLAMRWIETLESAGLSADIDHALKTSVNPGDIADYVTKYGHLPAEQSKSWTVADEITRQQSKRAGGLHGRTPWEILWDSQWSEADARLWREYVAATKGRSQLQWSRGTKELLGVTVESDETIVQKDETLEAQILAIISPEQWRVFDQENVIHHLVSAAAEKDLDKIERMLDTANNRLAASVVKVQCLPCSVDAGEPVWYTRKGDALVCPHCGRVSKHKPV